MSSFCARIANFSISFSSFKLKQTDDLIRPTEKKRRNLRVQRLADSMPDQQLEYNQPVAYSVLSMVSAFFHIDRKRVDGDPLVGPTRQTRDTR
jgi:hypothetical protein